MEYSLHDEDVNQIMVVGSSMETSDESSEKNVVVESHERRMIKRYTVTKTILEVRDIKIEEIVNGVVTGIKKLTNETILKKNVETFEETVSSANLSSFVSSTSSSHNFADISESSSFERNRPIRRSIIKDIDQASQEQEHVQKILSQRNSSEAIGTLESSFQQESACPMELPALGNSPAGDDLGLESSKESLFKFPCSQRPRRKKFSTSTSISEDDRASLAGRSFIPDEISSIRKSIDASIDLILISSETSQKSDDSPRCQVECTSPSIISSKKKKTSGNESMDLFSDRAEMENEFCLFPKLTDKSDSKESSGKSRVYCPVVGDSPQILTDVIPPTESSEASGNGTKVGLSRKRRPRLAIRRYSMIRRLPAVIGSPVDIIKESGDDDDEMGKELKHGTAVYTRWTDDHFYPGVVDRAVGGGGGGDDAEFVVLFDDGHLYQVKRSDIIICNLIKMNSSVMADRSDEAVTPQTGPSTPRGRKSKHWSEVAEVIGHISRGGGRKSYLVKFMDGKEFLTERKKVTLSLVQAGKIFGFKKDGNHWRSLRQLTPDVSTDNLVEGKRKRRPPTPLSQSELWNFPCSMTSPKKKRMMSRSKVSSTPRTKTRKYTSFKERSESYDPCPPVIICSPPAHHRPGAAKRPAKRALQLHHPMVKSTIFSGLTFLITHVWKSQSHLERERMMVDGEGCSQSFCTSTPTADVAREGGVELMNRDLIIELIKSGGGKILEEFDVEAVSKCKHTCYVVSDSCQRTIKYLCCLAFGIPCVSHHWILCSSNQNKLENYKLYLLPIGYSIKRKMILVRDHHHDRPSPLYGLHIILRLQNEATSATWNRVLVAAGCKVVVVVVDGEENKLENHLKKSSHGSFLVTDVSFRSNREGDCIARAGVTTVSTEWVVQCIINDAILDPNESLKYKP